jgi:predicted component of viral defense system (DUF524 family)
MDSKAEMLKVMYLGQSEVLLLETEPIMRYAKVKYIDGGKIVDVCLSSLTEKKDRIKPISLSWFGGVEVAK